MNYPVQSVAIRKSLAMNDTCPECGGSLDTGWECNDCHFDAMRHVARQFGLPERSPER